MKFTVGSVCSGIEAASFAWEGLDFSFDWFSEIEDFPSLVLKNKYPNINNVGDMKYIREMLLSREINSPDIICGGTPCQAFSLAGYRKGISDNRGDLTLEFANIININDEIRAKSGLQETVVFWENVEGVLTSKDNSFGLFLSILSGNEELLSVSKWANSGVIRGVKRNIAWRVLDAKYFGLPQQRKRVYLLAGGKDFYPENILFEEKEQVNISSFYIKPQNFIKNNNDIAMYRGYTDCLYSAYGTKWNGNAAAYNGSLFVTQNGRVRRLTPLECERLMGFSDNYTNINKSSDTSRYKAIGNSWAVPVVKKIGIKLENYLFNGFFNISSKLDLLIGNKSYIPLHKDEYSINTSEIPNNIRYGDLYSIIDTEAKEKFYLSPQACAGILRRGGKKINQNLFTDLQKCSSFLI
ncbi:DNA cytosine methyltransferase [Francisella sp. LA112445]|uniref:DNA cytosine methyltransferase n=1 Tax=Francisella sp. LA112445 TaxID=1395624 RepID=UPI001788C45F|nr:DNA cytosine methyltransferase [Francisella sp. LA112445]QIW10568.1 restriction endonuclease subunit M [Francisella sp. LA112445]